MVIIFAMGSAGMSYAQGLSLGVGTDKLPAPGTMVPLSQPFNPPLLKGIKVYTDDPFRFDFILEKGDSKQADLELKDESDRLIKYFLASLTVPEQDLWVNLSPYEKDRIVPDAFGQTEMGYELLAQDYLLKQITASVIYPEGELGKVFWQKIYAKAQEMFGTTDIPIDTFNKVWIVAEKAVVFENAKAGTAYVVDSKLRVMLESDYLALDNSDIEALDGNKSSATQELGKQLMREVIIPALEREVNEGKNFAPLRQVYHSLILASWYKKKIKESLLSQVYVDQDRVYGVNVDDPAISLKIWDRYVQAFKKGVFNFIKEEQDAQTMEMLSRKYVSGGFNLKLDAAMKTTADPAMLPQDDAKKRSVVQVRADVATGEFDVDTGEDDDIWAQATESMVGRTEAIPEGIPGQSYRGRYKSFINWLENDPLLPIQDMGPSALVDIGSGRGYATIALARAVAKLNPQMRVYGVDTRDYDRTIFARDMLPSNLEFQKDDHKLEHAVVGERIRVITMFNVMRYYFPDQKRRMVQEMGAKRHDGDFLVIGEGGPRDRPDKLGFIVFQKIHGELIPKKMVFDKSNVSDPRRAMYYLSSWADLMSVGQSQIWKPFLDAGLKPGTYTEREDGLIVLPLQQRSALVAFMRKQWQKVTKTSTDQAQKGGIDLTPEKMDLQTTGSGEEIKFHLDPAQLEKLRNIPGLTSVIINIQPMTDLNLFLGLKHQANISVAVK